MIFSLAFSILLHGPGLEINSANHHEANAHVFASGLAWPVF